MIDTRSRYSDWVNDLENVVLDLGHEHCECVSVRLCARARVGVCVGVCVSVCV